MTTPYDYIDPEQLAVFVQEYIRAGDKPDGGVIALSRAGLRDVRYHPQHVVDRLLARPDVQAAIKSARTFHTPKEAVDVSAESILDDAEAIYQKALDERQYPAALSAKKLQAEILGILKQTVNVNHNVTVKNISDEQLERIAKGGIIEGEFKELDAVQSIN